MLEKLISKKNLRFILIIGTISFITLLLINFIVSNEHNTIIRLFNSIDSAVASFGGHHGDTLILLIEYSKTNILFRVALVAYLFASILAIFFSFCLVYDLFKLLYFKSREGTRMFNEDSYVIFGYNEEAIELIENTEGINPKNIHIMSSSEFNLDQLKKIGGLGVSYDYFKKEELKDFLNRKRFNKVRNILFCESKPMENFSLCKNLSSYLKENNNLNISLIPMNDAEDMAINNNCNELFIKSITKNVIIAQSIVKSVSTEICENLEKYRSKDLKCLIVGFGKTGKDLFSLLINQLVIRSDNKISIDIVDTQASYALKNTIENVCQEYKNSDGLYIAGNVSDGILEVNTFNCSYNDYKIHEKLMYDEYDFVIVNLSSEENYSNYIESNRLLINSLKDTTKFVVPVIKNNEYTRLIMDSFDNVIVSKVYEIFNLNLLQNNEIEDNAMKFNYNYHRINKELIDDKYTLWRKSEWYNKKSARYQSLHQNINIALKQNYIGINEDMCNLFKYIDNSEKVDEIINSNKMLKEFAMMEHRRWTYFVILDGYKYNPEKNKKKKHSDCIMNWAMLREYKKTTLIFDIIPLMVLTKDEMGE